MINKEIQKIAKYQFERLIKEQELLIAKFILQNPYFPIEQISLVYDKSDPLKNKYYLEVRSTDKEQCDA